MEPISQVPTPTELVVESHFSRQQAESAQPQIPPLPFTTEAISTDWQGLLYHHQCAAQARTRPAASRRWHAGQAAAIRARLAGDPPTAWDWASWCEMFRPKPGETGSPLT